MVNFGLLAAEIGSVVWRTPANFNGFRVLVSLLQRRRWTKANQTLHDVWPSPIYIFGGSCPITEFCQVKNSLCVQVLRFPILAALLHGTRVVGVRQTLWHWAEGAIYIWQGDHHVGHWPTFQFNCLIYNTNRALFLWIEIFICTTDITMQLPTDGRATCRIGICVQRKRFQWGSDGRSLCVQISMEQSYPLPIYWYHSKGNWLRFNFAEDSFYIMKLCSRLFVLYCRNCPKDDKFRYLIPSVRKLGAA